MAVLWREIRNGTLYEVRSAGRTRRLYIDGLLNTQYNPRTPFSGSLWDFLSLPALLCAPRPRRVLLLGVGGGAVILQLQRLLAPEAIVGVELAATNIRIAQRFFGLRMPNLTLAHADARVWLDRWRGAPFDLIIDDLYATEDGEPVRAITADRAWFTQLLRHLTADGMLVFNHVSWRELHDSPALQDARVRSRFGTALQLTGPRFENAVLALYRNKLKSPVSAADLRARFAVHRLGSPGRLHFGLRTLY